MQRQTSGGTRAASSSGSDEHKRRVTGADRGWQKRVQDPEWPCFLAALDTRWIWKSNLGIKWTEAA
jgi:hypothetical protein